MGLEALRIKNLRGLSDTTRIPLRPITVLVGRNSSGKSTFLRAFPLLRQSVETATESPILWYKPRRVDFGSLENAIHDQASERSVTFEFSVRLPTSAYVALETPVFDVAMTLAEGTAPKGAYVQAYEIRCLEHTASLRFTPRGDLQSFQVNSAAVLPTEAAMSLGGAAYLIPTLRPERHGKVTYQPVVQPIRIDPPQYRDPDTEPLLDELSRELQPIFHGNASDETLKRIGDDLYIGSRDAMWQALPAASQGSASRRTSKARGRAAPRSRPSSTARSRALSPGSSTPSISRWRTSCPASGTWPRSARRPSARTGCRISPSATSTPTARTSRCSFARSRSRRSRASPRSRASTWLEARVEVTGLHAEILVREPRSSRYINLVDIGFGYTEVLPLMAILWSTCCRPLSSGSRPTSLLAIEQPELHLHPAHQVRLAKVIAGAWRASRDAKREVKIMVETHSECIVNGLGELIRKGVIAASDVQIVLFDQDAETRKTEVRLAGYTDDGALNDAWPFGFFAPVADD